MARVLVVDDSDLILQMLQMVLSQAGHDAVTVSTWPEAEAAYAAQPPDVVITDLNLPDQADPIRSFTELGNAPVIVVSGRPQGELDQLAADRGAAGAVSKDVGLPGMSAALPDLIDRLAT